jgi:hypothetical protein
MVREARRRRVFRVLTTTNGSLLDEEHRRELLGCGLTHVNISIDAAQPATHARLRPGSDLERIREGTAALMLVASGVMTLQRVSYGLAAIPFAFLGGYVGDRFSTRLPERPFRALALAVLFLAGAYSVLSGLA